MPTGATWKSSPLGCPPELQGLEPYVCVGSGGEGGAVCPEGGVRVGGGVGREEGGWEEGTQGTLVHQEHPYFSRDPSQGEASFIGGRASHALPGGTWSLLWFLWAVCALCPACWRHTSAASHTQAPQGSPCQSHPHLPTLIVGGSPQA